MKFKKINYLSCIAGITLCALILLLVYIARMYIDLSALQKKYETNQNTVTYPYHCAFITDSSSDDFWDSVYEAAKAEGQLNGIYVENFGKNLSQSYTSDKLLKMAIAAKVDAILVEPSGNYNSVYLMNAASEAGIAVGTIYRDELRSSRYNYTGVNSISIGSEYGKLAVEYSDKNASSFMVLLNDDDTIQERRLLTSSIGQSLSEKRSDAKLDTMVLNEESTFDAEEDIRQFLKESHDNIDVIICTSLLQTQYVSQLAIDMNYVGDFTIIGSYQNPSVLDALKNGVISASLVVDTKQMGEKAVKNLAEFLTYGHSSDYSQVETYTIIGEDAARIIRESQSSQEGEENET